MQGADISAPWVGEVVPAGQVCKSRREKVRGGLQRRTVPEPGPQSSASAASCRRTRRQEELLTPLSLLHSGHVRRGEQGYDSRVEKRRVWLWTQSDPCFIPPKMMKDLKSLQQLAVPLLFLALCVAVQRTDSAVSVFTLLWCLHRFRALFSAKIRARRSRGTCRSLCQPARSSSGSPGRAQLRFLNRESFRTSAAASAPSSQEPRVCLLCVALTVTRSYKLFSFCGALF